VATAQPPGSFTHGTSPDISYGLGRHLHAMPPAPQRHPYPESVKAIHLVNNEVTNSRSIVSAPTSHYWSSNEESSFTLDLGSAPFNSLKASWGCGTSTMSVMVGASSLMNFLGGEVIAEATAVSVPPQPTTNRISLILPSEKSSRRAVESLISSGVFLIVDYGVTEYRDSIPIQPVRSGPPQWIQGAWNTPGARW